MGKIVEKAIFRSAFLIVWHCILSAELTKTHSFRLFFGDFAHWVTENKFHFMTLNLITMETIGISRCTPISMKSQSNFVESVKKFHVDILKNL